MRTGSSELLTPSRRSSKLIEKRTRVRYIEQFQQRGQGSARGPGRFAEIIGQGGIMTMIARTAIDRRDIAQIIGGGRRRICQRSRDAGHRADASDQARLCQPADRPARRVRRSRQLHHREFQGGRQGRHQARQRRRSGGSRRQGQPVESEPRRAGRQGSDRPGQDRPDAGGLDAGDHQSGLDAMRDRRGAVHLDGGAMAALVHRPPGRSGRRAAGMEEVQLHLSLLLGARRRHRGLHQHVGPGADQQIGRRPVSRTTATAMPGATSRSASRRCWRKAATS